MSVVDAIIILFILFWGVIGFKRGFVKQTTKFIGFILILVVAFLLKNSVALYMYEKLPLFDFFGLFKGLTIFNILIYELVAFFLVLAVLVVLLKILTFFSGIIEKILNFTVVLGVPSKILGLLVGLIQGYIVAFLILFILSQPSIEIKLVTESKLAPKILYNSPILSSATSNTLDSFNELYSLKEKYENTENNDQFNREALDILLKHNIVTVESIEKLVTSGKLKIEGIELILNKYR